LCVGVVVTGVVGWAWGVGASVALLGLFGAAAVAVALFIRRRWRRLRQLRQQATIEFCDALAAELAAGLPVLVALRHASEIWPEWKPLSAAVGMGTDVPETLRALAGQPGAQGLGAIAASWEVAGHSGAALSEVLERIGQVLRSDEEARAEIAAALGPTRSTARLLAVLPAFGIALGSSMGADPLGFLIHTPVGRGCLITGLLLAGAGLWWVERLVESAEA
jgi:tight adherence protein B